MKIKVRETMEIYPEGFLDRSLDDIIKLLEEYKKDDWEGILYALQYGGMDFYLYKDRVETDEEYKVRMEKLNREEDKRKKSRREMYEKLKKEFGE